ncbi:MAG: hypothetical protein JW855_00205, partial [Gammaproteobacteria bacterium]|nr:hypothetical protein [Gammaproteobacteria bacterium]
PESKTKSPQKENTTNPENVEQRPISSNSDLGIICTYKNLDECKNDIRADFIKAHHIDLLLQIGQQELGANTASFFYPLIEEGKVSPNTSIRVLRASIDSPFLSKERALSRGKSDRYDRWAMQLDNLCNVIKHLSKKVNITDRKHKEPFLWRIFIFDDIVYLSAYLYKSKNDNQAPVYKIKDGKNSLYIIFKKYFETLWLKYDPSFDNDIDRWVDWS